MAVDMFSQATGAIPFSTTQTTQDVSLQNESANTARTGQNLNVYSDAQRAAQNQALSSLGQVLAGGSIPSNFGLPQSAWDAATHNWQKNTAPLLTAQHGSGTPALNSSMEELLLQLAGMSGQQAMSNYQGLANSLGQFAFQPQGNQEQVNEARTGQTALNRNVQTKETGSNPGASIDALISIINSTIQSLPFG